MYGIKLYSCVSINTTNTSDKLRVVYDCIILYHILYIDHTNHNGDASLEKWEIALQVNHINCNCRAAATLRAIETWLVAGL
jgi:hypothetical protein